MGWLVSCDHKIFEEGPVSSRLRETCNQPYMCVVIVTPQCNLFGRVVMIQLLLFDAWGNCLHIAGSHRITYII